MFVNDMWVIDDETVAELKTADIDDIGRWLEEALADAHRFEKYANMARMFAAACEKELDNRQ